MIRTTNHYTAREIVTKLLDQEVEIKKLEYSGKALEAKKLAVSVVAQACKYGVYDVASTAYRCLTKYYETINRRNSKAREYREKFRYYKRLMEERDEIRAFYLDIHNALDRTRTIEHDTIYRSARYVKISREYETTSDHGPYFYHIFYLIITTDCNLNKRYHDCINTAKEALGYFERQTLSFSISRFYFLCVIADSYLNLRDYTLAETNLNAAAQIGISEGSAHNNFVIIRSRLNLIRGIDIDHSNVIDITLDHKRLFDILEVYDELSVGRSVSDWGKLWQYRNDPTGLGISFNIARLWSARIAGDIPDHIERMEKYKSRHNLDKRSVLMIDFFLYNCDVTQELRRHIWNPDIEIIPYETTVERVSRLPL